MRRFLTRLALLLPLLVFASVSALPPNTAEAHRHGCHSRHSCPSDTGSYRCGDRGDSTYCLQPNAPPPKPKAPAPKPKAPPPKPKATPSKPKTPAPVVSSPAGTHPAVVAHGGNVRATPSLRGRVLDQLHAKETVQLLAKTRNGAWYKITDKRGVTGWTSVTLLTISSKDAAVPIQ